MSLFKGESPQLGTTVITATGSSDNPLTIQAANGTSVLTVSNAGAVAPSAGLTVAASQSLTVTTADKLTVGGRIIPTTWTVKAISPIVTPATAGWAYIAPRACKVVSINEVHSAGAAVTINLRKITDVNTPAAAAGATVKELLSAALNANFTANTVAAGALSATAADYTFAAGDKLAWNASGTLTSYVGEITVEFQAV